MIEEALTPTTTAISQQPVARVTGTDVGALCVGTDMFTEMRTIVAFVNLWRMKIITQLVHYGCPLTTFLCVYSVPFPTSASPSIVVQLVSSIALTSVRSHSVHTNLLAAIGGAGVTLINVCNKYQIMMKVLLIDNLITRNLRSSCLPREPSSFYEHRSNWEISTFTNIK